MQQRIMGVDPILGFLENRERTFQKENLSINTRGKNAFQE